jgi:3'-phosphoadenosine 5'-phosphosulfate sulfotransferase (PAPS reductase)/FAD synthetase
MKHIVQFSGGAASAYVAKLVLDEHGHDNTILMWHDTKAEHPDTYRFIKDVSEYLGKEITEESDGRDLWEVIEDNNCLPSSFIPFCTRILKAEPAERFLASVEEPFTLYNGFGMDEYRRVQRATARAEALGRTVVSPLFERKISNEYVKHTISTEWGIRLPEAYKVLHHNNCIPCFKAGKPHFYRVWKHFNCQFERAASEEERIGNTVFKDKSLRELAQKWESQQEMDFGDDPGVETIPCMCSD